MKKINCEPKWVGIYPLMKSWIFEGNNEQKEYVASELKRLCELADKINKK